MFKTLDDYKNKKVDKDDKKKTTSYVGGGKSGMEVENNKEKEIESIVN